MELAELAGGSFCFVSISIPLASGSGTNTSALHWPSEYWSSTTSSSATPTVGHTVAGPSHVTVHGGVSWTGGVFGPDVFGLGAHRSVLFLTGCERARGAGVTHCRAKSDGGARISESCSAAFEVLSMRHGNSSSVHEAGTRRARAATAAALSCRSFFSFASLSRSASFSSLSARSCRCASRPRLLAASRCAGLGSGAGRRRGCSSASSDTSWST
mmetsp:Transcript_12710/g.21888  ORF Transcript_12710/g.21888 Transcript_12710/m.21888 type:complete len:214 (-) Transcript_12710:647-1288(-)